MPKQPRVSLPNLDSLAVSPCRLRREDPAAGGEKRTTCPELQHVHRTAPLYLLRMVILDCSGKPAVILETRELKAATVKQAKAEADRHSRRSKRHPLPHGLEIIDGLGIVMARRNSEGKTWSFPGQWVAYSHPSASYQMAPRPGGREG